jgi:L-serine dehydratase
MSLSVFDIFKIGIGPSSSHTMGPMNAARAFVELLAARDLLARTAQVSAQLYGSLALTGRGHCTDRAILLGLEGLRPDTIDSTTIEPTLQRIRTTKRIRLAGTHEIDFDEPLNLLFHMESVLPGHSNGMRFTAHDAASNVLAREEYYSIGGGFVIRAGEEAGAGAVRAEPPYPFDSGARLLEHGKATGLEIHELMLARERTWRSETEVRAGLMRIWRVMQDCVRRGFEASGLLPGVLGVRRRAPKLYRQLMSGDPLSPMHALDWVNVYALAVNEENAAGGQVVTAPTNGAAGIVPAVLHYYRRFESGADDDGVVRFLLTAAAIGMLYKKKCVHLRRRNGMPGRGRRCLFHGGGRLGIGAQRQQRANRKRRRNRYGTQFGANLRSRGRISANSLHRAQCHGVREGNQCRAPGAPRRRFAQSIPGPGHLDHASNRSRYVDDLQRDIAGRSRGQRSRMLT